MAQIKKLKLIKHFNYCVVLVYAVFCFNVNLFCENLPKNTGVQPAKFDIRGVKGLWWYDISKYKDIMAWMPSHGFNFLMFCYSSFPGSSELWRKGYTESELKGMKDVADYCSSHGITLCLAINPGIYSRTKIVYSSDEEYQLMLASLVKVYKATGIKWYALCLDDIIEKLSDKDKTRFKTLAEAHTFFVNRVYKGLKEQVPGVNMIFCPAAYTTGFALKNTEYSKYVGEKVDSSILFFWTGPTVCSSNIIDEDVGKIRKFFGSTREIVIWDNYPVNDYIPWRLLLSPVKGRSKTLYKHVRGLISNPMKQMEASKLPLAAIGEYLSDPGNYDPERAMARSIAELGGGEVDYVLKDLVGIYGRYFLGDKKFEYIDVPENPNDVRVRIAKLRGILVVLRNNTKYRRLYDDVRPAIESDIVRLEQYIIRKKGCKGKSGRVVLKGLDFTGGGGEVYRYRKSFRYEVNYVYAKPSKLDVMSSDFWVNNIDGITGAELVIEAMCSKKGGNCRVEIRVNDNIVFSGKNNFRAEPKWTTQSFAVPPKMLRTGKNIIIICNIEPEGKAGSPPWFMISKVEVVLRNEEK
ncbi:MAG: beta-N-acetylglucosaminidase domain-containing protein [Elusimicrobiota bacterium]